MGSLSRRQKDMLLDFYFRCGTEKEIQESSDLIASNPEAAELYSQLEDTLFLMDEIHNETCPSHLVEKTLGRISSAGSSKKNLDSLLEKEQTKSSGVIKFKSSYLAPVVRIASFAAMIAIVAGIGFPTTQFMRQKAWQTQCQANMANVSAGIGSYTEDNDGVIPSVATATGSPWWKVGYQGSENHSNTRNVWILVKGDYVELKDLLCPGRSKPREVISDNQIENLNDFPTRNYLDYSYRVICVQYSSSASQGRTIILGDLNPLFENACSSSDVSGGVFSKFKLTEELLKRRSTNHRGKGQNVLFTDGSVEFMRDRKFDNVDDIYTLDDRSEYTGSEFPTCVQDTFLAP